MPLHLKYKILLHDNFQSNLAFFSCYQFKHIKLNHTLPTANTYHTAMSPVTVQKKTQKFDKTKIEEKKLNKGSKLSYFY